MGTESLLGSAEPAEPAAPAAQAVGDGGTPALVPDASTGQADNDWKSSLPDDIRNDPSMAVIKDVTGLAKTYVHSQKMLGGDKIVVPNKYATEQDWRNIFTKLGLPESVDKYEVKAREGVDTQDGFFVGFKTLAHQAGVLPGQAQKLYDWFETETQKLTEQQEAAAQAEAQKQVGALKSEWGQAFDMKVKAAKAVLQKFGDETFHKYLEETGLTNNVQLTKFLSKVGESLAEDTFKGEGQTDGVYTPDEAKKEINKVMGDKKHPYFDGQHPSHADAVAEMQKLFKFAYGG